MERRQAKSLRCIDGDRGLDGERPRPSCDSDDRSTTFGDDSNDGSTTFGDDSNDGSATFGDDSDDGPATFEDDSDDGSATFGDDSDDGSATFGDDSDDESTAFGDDSDDESTAFEDEVETSRLATSPPATQRGELVGSPQACPLPAPLSGVRRKLFDSEESPKKMSPAFKKFKTRLLERYMSANHPRDSPPRETGSADQTPSKQ
ncbi:hypothetical protein MRX96_012621 [Rhipicephalus microplus]